MSFLRNTFKNLALKSGVERSAFFTRKFEALNYKTNFSEKGDEATVLHPGISYGDFQGANPSAQRMGLVAESCFHNVIFAAKSKTGSHFIEFDTMNENHLPITASNDLELTPSLYYSRVAKSPLDVKINLYSIGNSSMCLLARAYSHKSDTLIFSNIMRVIRIDLSTRKVVSLPDWWREKYTTMAIAQQPLVIQSEPRPDDVISQKAYVTNHDTDYQGHTNWTSYIKYCLDAAFKLNAERILKHVSQEAVFEGLVKRVKTRYTGESFTGDVLDVYTWENPDISNTLNFEIHKGDKSVCHASLEYYASHECKDQ